MNKKVEGAFKSVREEFEDHLEAINENTNEIHSNYEHMCEIDAKLDKLGERVDEIQNVLKQLIAHEFKVTPDYSDIKLSVDEQKVFLAMYSTEQKISYSAIARVTGLGEETVKRLVTDLINKTIPLVKEYRHHEAFLQISEDFRQKQARESVLSLDPAIAKKIVNQLH